ncbi:MAG: glycoside hydrolase family 75 protein [Chthoniobacterales bacterium]
MARFRLKTLRRLALLLLLGAMAAIVLRWISLERWHAQLVQGGVVEISPTPTPVPSPSKPPVITGKIDSAKLFSGITVHSSVEPIPGGAASDERNDPQSYVLELKVLARVPAPNKSIDELAKVNPRLPQILPGLASMFSAEAVSPLFKDLYDTKVKQLRDNLVRLDQLLSRHNFYDTQTVLSLHHPQSHRRAVLLQADMDVDADGSDSDRLPAGTGMSPNFKPFTSYKWAKKTPEPNPYQPATEEKLKRLEGEMNAPNTSADRKRDLKISIAQTRDEIATMKKFSFLIGATDPYVVLPGSFARGDGGKVGDYVLVVFDDKILPAIVGDIGPNDKTGEASLRIAKEINNLATPMNRPVSDLKVTYLVFPGTADTPFGPPDYDKLSARCEKLVEEIGGATVPVHHWTNIIPTPTPTPTPTPSPTATTAPPTPPPGQTPAPAASATPDSSPSATFAFPTASKSPL